MGFSQMDNLIKLNKKNDIFDQDCQCFFSQIKHFVLANKQVNAFFFSGKKYKYKFTHSNPKWVIVPWWGHVANYDKYQFDM